MEIFLLELSKSWLSDKWNFSSNRSQQNEAILFHLTVTLSNKMKWGNQLAPNIVFSPHYSSPKDLKCRKRMKAWKEDQVCSTRWRYSLVQRRRNRHLHNWSPGWYAIPSILASWINLLHAVIYWSQKTVMKVYNKNQRSSSWNKMRIVMTGKLNPENGLTFEILLLNNFHKFQGVIGLLVMWLTLIKPMLC